MSTDFATHLQRQHALLGDFLALLEREQALLTTTPVAVDTLSDITEAKRRSAAELEALEAERRAIVATHGHSADSAGTARLAAILGCAPAWQAFVEDVSAARIANQANGLAIHRRLDFATRALSVLRRSADQSLYAANGRRHRTAGGWIDSGA